jgi:hypothetical protein
VKKHLFPFQGRVEFLGVNSPLLFEGGEGGGLGFYLCAFLPIGHAGMVRFIHLGDGRSPS